MALDGCMLNLVKNEISSKCLGSRVEKIHQPTKEEIIISLRTQGGTNKIIFSARASSPRVHLTSMPVENPKQPPMFCMLLRKHLGSGRLVDIRQLGFDRVLFFDFETINELGDLVVISIIIEVMGRNSNIIMVDKQSQRIIDSIRRVNPDMSSVRQIMPGMIYSLPPIQDKISISAEIEEIIEKMKSANRDVSLSKLLLETIEGVSPMVAREISYFATKGKDCIFSELTSDDNDRLTFYLKNFKNIIQGEQANCPTVVVSPDNSPKDFSFIKINQYGSSMLTKEFGYLGELLDNFYGNKDATERMKQRANDLLKLLINRTERISKKLALQKEELIECEKRELLKIYGDLISSNFHLIQKGQDQVVVQNYYDQSMPDVTIKLDVRLTPVQNSQKYYNDYRRADTAQKMLKKLLNDGESELKYLESVFDLLVRSASDNELVAIREELAEQGYIKTNRLSKKVSHKITPIKYLSSDGFTILCGRNNNQNDKLTFKEAHNYDLWLHTQKIPGSHTIIIADGREIPNSTIEEAAIIAATNSKAGGSAKIPVDYTYIKFVKKHPANKPGLVTYENFKTAIVDPNADVVHKLLVK